VLDPFLGSGASARVALELGRSCVGYELQARFLDLIRESLPPTLGRVAAFEERRVNAAPAGTPPGYQPRVLDAPAHSGAVGPQREPESKVSAILDERTIRLQDGRLVRLLGIIVPKSRQAAAKEYLTRFVLGKRVIIRPNLEANLEPSVEAEGGYVLLSNRLFVNRKMIEMGLALADRTEPHKHLARFIRAEDLAPGAADPDRSASTPPA